MVATDLDAIRVGNPNDLKMTDSDDLPVSTE